MRSRVPKAVILTTLAFAATALVAGAAQAFQQTGDPSPTFVGDAACAECHEEVAVAMAQQIHQRIQGFEVQGRAVGCEGCHGPGSAHAEEGDATLIRAFREGEAGQACVDCHRTQGMARFKASIHAANGLACQDCHSVHEASRGPLETCADCHAEVVAELQLPSHHPVREGKMSCSSCHDVHGVGVALLAKDHQRVNEACYDCHQEKEGPFVFEHAPVAESCSNCHRPHGSVANNLLTVSQPSLCLQCHEFHFHAGYKPPEDEEVDVGGIARENLYGAEGFNIAYTTNCTQCHAAVHGSDSPSQTVTSGRALTH